MPAKPKIKLRLQRSHTNLSKASNKNGNVTYARTFSGNSVVSLNENDDLHTRYKMCKL